MTRTTKYMFQSRNRGSFHFKNTYSVRMNKVGTCFNLVIEVLFISRLKICRSATGICSFQSRNRGSFHFKCSVTVRYSVPLGDSCFNLVIEVLFISSKKTPCPARDGHRMFQSRNRGSFHFKKRRMDTRAGELKGFNLVIEVLFISRLADLYGCDIDNFVSIS